MWPRPAVGLRTSVFPTSCFSVWTALRVDRDAYLEGGPTVVVEIRSPGDETMEKLPFYAQLGVPEVWIVDRDTQIARALCAAGRPV